jgi:hypothetical protein
MDDHTIRVAAGWIYRNRDRAQWWTPFVITPANPDRSAPAHTITEAFQIFEALSQKGLLREDGQMNVPDSTPISKYRINWGSIKEFKEYAALSWPDRTFPRWFLDFLEAWHKVLIAAVILIFTAFFQSIFSKFGEDSYSWIANLFK